MPHINLTTFREEIAHFALCETLSTRAYTKNLRHASAQPWNYIPLKRSISRLHEVAVFETVCLTFCQGAMRKQCCRGIYARFRVYRMLRAAITLALASVHYKQPNFMEIRVKLKVGQRSYKRTPFVQHRLVRHTERDYKGSHHGVRTHDVHHEHRTIAELHM